MNVYILLQDGYPFQVFKFRKDAVRIMRAMRKHCREHLPKMKVAYFIVKEQVF